MFTVVRYRVWLKCEIDRHDNEMLLGCLFGPVKSPVQYFFTLFNKHWYFDIEPREIIVFVSDSLFVTLDEHNNARSQQNTENIDW